MTQMYVMLNLSNTMTDLRTTNQAGFGTSSFICNLLGHNAEKRNHIVWKFFSVTVILEKTDWKTITSHAKHVSRYSMPSTQMHVGIGRPE